MPILFSDVVNLHPLAIIVAILIFGGLWGFWGYVGNLYSVIQGIYVYGVWGGWDTGFRTLAWLV